MFKFKTGWMKPKTFDLLVRVASYVPLFVMTLFPSLVFSQIGGALPPPPVHSQIDSRGIDMLSGTPSLPGMYVSIGTRDSGLVRDPGRELAERDNFTGTLTSISITNSTNIMNLPIGSYIRVSSGLDTELFVADTYENHDKTGGQLTCTSTLCTYINRNGDVTDFDKTKTNGFSQGISEGGTSRGSLRNIALQTKITRVNGEIITLTYQKNIFFGSSTNRMIIGSVSSSLGWILKYEYVITTSTASQLKGSRSIKAINTSKEYCDPGIGSCENTSNVWPKSTLSHEFITSQVGSTSNYKNYLTATITNPIGKQYKYSKTSYTALGSDVSDSYQYPSGIIDSYGYPGCDFVPANNMCYENEGTGKVDVVKRGAHSFNYSYSRDYTGSEPQGAAVILIKGPDGTAKSWDNKGILLGYIDNLGRSTSYRYNTATGKRIDKVVDPDATPSMINASGGYTDYDYDDRGNITSIRLYPKNDGNYLSMSASYPISCSNTKTCNKPESITDINGVLTTYKYHPDTGYIESITQAAVNNIEAQKRFKYEQKTPYVKNSSGGATASSPVWVLTEVSECMTMTLNTCVDTADEKRTIYSDFNDNLSPKKLTVQDGTGAIKLETITEYDNYGNIVAVDGPRSGTDDKVFYFYDLMRQKVGEIGIDPDGSGALPRQAVKMIYNDDGKVTSVNTGITFGTTKADLDAITVKQQAATEYSTDHGLPVVERFYAAGVLEKVTQKSYDNKLRVDCVAQRLNRNAWSSLPTSACALGAAGPEGNDRITKYNYDLTGAVLSTISGYGTALQRVDRTNTYEPVNGLLKTEADGKGNTTYYKYDNFNRLFKTVYPTPANGIVESTTDYTQTNYKSGSSLVDSVRLRDGLVINFSEYDPLGRVKTKSGALSESFTYNNFNQVLTHTNNSTGGASQNSSYVFNSLGWLKSESRVAGGVSLGSVSYGHDAFGRRTSLTWPDNFTVIYDYKVNGVESEYLRKITESNNTLLASFDYYDNGRRKSLTRGNGVVTTYGYNDLDQLRNQSTDVGGTNTADDLAESFTYALSGQLKTQSLTVANNNYVYTPTVAAAINYTPDALNRIASVNGASFGYDGRGNLTSDNTGASYSYNANNLLLNATTSGVATTLSYDAENRLHSVTKSGATTKFMYDGTDLIAETNSSNSILRRYVHGPETDDPIVWYEGSGTGDKRYYTANRQGSIVGVTLQSGMSTSINAYDEYGIQKLNTIGRFQYTGQTWIPEIGLYYYKARFYNPSLGRFMQTDPVGYKDGMNWYAYVGNDPVNKTDPTGKSSCGLGGAGACRDFFRDLSSGSSYIVNADGKNASSPKPKGVDSEGTPKRFKISIGGEDPTKNTVVTDGNGGMKTQLSSKNSPTTAPVVLGGVAVHEGQHIADINKYASNLRILKSQPANRVVEVPEKTLGILERRATRVEMDYLSNLLPSQNSDGAASINERLSQLEDYYEKHE